MNPSIPNQLRKRQDMKQRATKCGHAFFPVYEGSCAFRHGKSPVECPYVLGTPQHNAWMSGWMAGFDGRTD